MSRVTLKMLYAKDAKRNRRTPPRVEKRFIASDPDAEPGQRSSGIESVNSDGSTTAWYIYRCFHCHQYEGQHAEGACLFMPTKFQEMTAKEEAAAFPPEPALLPVPGWPPIRGLPTFTATCDIYFEID